MTALHLRQGPPELFGEIFPLRRREVAGDHHALAPRGRFEHLEPEFVVFLPPEPGPERIEAPFPRVSPVTDPADEELDRRQLELLEGLAAPNIHAERDI